ncbi:MAG: matrixin family metalloprotease [Myxococcales bacterium]
MTVGQPLYWPGGATEIWVDPEGSALRGITEPEAQEALARAIEHWSSVVCPDGQPLDLELVLKGSSATFQGQPDELNVLRFLDDTWPYPVASAAQTSVGFDLETGALSRARVEVNSALHDITLTAQSASDVDLEGTLTHELGHFLGLDHSDVPGATMQAEASGMQTLELRTLEADDVAGICEIYGQGQLPELEDDAPKTSSDASTCSASPAATDAPLTSSWLVALSGVVLLGRRRSQRRI